MSTPSLIIKRPQRRSNTSSSSSARTAPLTTFSRLNVPRSRDSVHNLLFEGIIKADGSPGRHFTKATQFQAIAPFKRKYFISLDENEKAPYGILPSPTLNFAPIKPTFPPGTPTSS